MNAFWVPQIKKLQAFGPQYQNRFEWPSLSHLKKLDLNQELRLTSLELGASTNLFGMRFHFTQNFSSPYIEALQTNEKGYKSLSLDRQRKISDIYIS